MRYCFSFLFFVLAYSIFYPGYYFSRVFFWLLYVVGRSIGLSLLYMWGYFLIFCGFLSMVVSKGLMGFLLVFLLSFRCFFWVLRVVFRFVIYQLGRFERFNVHCNVLRRYRGIFSDIREILG